MMRESRIHHMKACLNLNPAELHNRVKGTVPGILQNLEIGGADKEFGFLECLVTNLNKPVSRSSILD